MPPLGSWRRLAVCLPSRPSIQDCSAFRAGGGTEQNLHLWGQEKRENRNPEYLVWAVSALRSHTSRWIT